MSHRPRTAVSGTPRSASGRSGHLDPATGEIEAHPARVGLRAARRHRRTGRRALDHRRRAERDRPRRSRDRRRSRCSRFPATDPNANLNTATFDERRRPVVHGPEPGSTAASIPDAGRLECSTRPAAPARTGSRRHPTATSTTPRWPEATSRRSTRTTGEATIDRSADAGQGARRVWSDCDGPIWVSEWNAGQLGRVRPGERQVGGVGRSRRQPHAYAVYVDDEDIVWLSDFGANALVRFDPATEKFESIELPSARRRRAPDPRPPGRDLGRRIRHRQAGRHPDLTSLTSRMVSVAPLRTSSLV